MLEYAVKMRELSQEALAQSYRSVSALNSAFSELPIALAKGMKQLHQGELTLRIRHDGLDTFQQHLERASNRVSFSLLIAAIVVASSIVMSFHTGPHFEGITIDIAPLERTQVTGQQNTLGEMKCANHG